MRTPNRSTLRGVWSVVWRIAVLASIGLLAVAVGYDHVLEREPTESWADVLMSLRLQTDIALGLVSLALYPLRRRAPLMIPVIVVVLSVLSLSSTGAAAACVISVAARRRTPHVAIVSGLYLAASVAVLFVPPLSGGTDIWEELLVSVLGVGAVLLLGLLVGTRRQLREQRARQRAEAETATLDRARAQERARIAREMHDVLGHRLSLMSVHAGALEYRTDLSREQTAQAATIISENSRLALDELREVLTVLRDDDDAAQRHRPQPVASDIPALIAQARAAGASIETVAVETDGISDAAGRQLFRITQELLTNARKHAAGASIAFSLTADPADGIRLSTSNRSAVQAATHGFGLVGIAERAQLLGGTLTVDDAHGRFRVEVTAPWTR